MQTPVLTSEKEHIPACLEHMPRPKTKHKPIIQNKEAENIRKGILKKWVVNMNHKMQLRVG
jgi:hypothetical protein